MKKYRILLLAFLLCFSLVGCSTDELKNKTFTKEEKENFVTDFLIEFFTFNCNERYDVLIKTIENDESHLDVEGDGIQPLSDIQQKAIEDYYAGLAKYVTEECLTTMQANRLPFQLDKFVKEKGLVESIDYFVLDGVSGPENTYLYEVYFEGNSEEIAFIEVLKGQVSIEIVDGEIKVTSISIVQ